MWLPGAATSGFSTKSYRVGPRELYAANGFEFPGEQAVAYFTRSTRTTNVRLRRDFAWTPRYPTYREGLDQIVAAWNAESSRAPIASAAGG